MAITGKLIGALIGSIAGPFGTLFGGLIGHLFDRAAEDRRLTGAARPQFAVNDPGGYRTAADPVSQAQVNFLTCLIGLSISVADVDGRVKVSHVDAMKAFFRQNFTFPSVDQELIQRLIDEMYRNKERIDLPGLCAYYAAVSTFQGRVLLLRLLFQIARADNLGVSRPEEELIRRITLLLGMGEQVFRQVRAEFVQGEPGRAWQVLGLSPDAEVEQIKMAYRQLTLQNHPDKVANLGPEFVRIAEEKFKSIQEAYEEIRREKGF
jgi:DnaJ like chaperone protein